MHTEPAINPPASQLAAIAPKPVGTDPDSVGVANQGGMLPGPDRAVATARSGGRR
jgi:hypothetical protein